MTKKQLEKALTGLIKAIEEVEGYRWNDGCGCCSNELLTDSDEWRDIMKAVEAVAEYQ